MDRATRDKFTAATNRDLTTGNACLETPRPVFERMNELFGPFNLDLTGDLARHHLPRWFGPGSPVGELDALEAFWPQWGENGFSNPPYGPFVQALLEWARLMAAFGCSSSLLIPLRVTRAFKDHVIAPVSMTDGKGAAVAGASDLIFCDKRIPFFENGLPRLNERAWVEEGVARADGALFDSIIVRFSAGHSGPARLGVFEVPPCVSAEDLERAAALRRAKDLG